MQSIRASDAMKILKIRIRVLVKEKDPLDPQHYLGDYYKQGSLFRPECSTDPTTASGQVGFSIAQLYLLSACL